MTVDDAITSACSSVGIKPPQGTRYGVWMKTDTLSGANGRGDGRVMVNERSVTAYNWQTGEKVSVSLNDGTEKIDRREVKRKVEQEERKKKERAAKAAQIANDLVRAATLRTHPYLALKGFPEEKALVLDVAAIRHIGGDYLVDPGEQEAIIIPARAGNQIRSAQLIFEQGRKKFLYGGETAGTSHRIAVGRDCWHCEGFATGLSLRSAFASFGYKATILCCFSASNVEVVSRTAQGRPFIAADNDKPQPQFKGLGTGQYFAERSGVRFVMPPMIGEDFNDMHQREGLFAVQRLICDFLKGARR